MFYYTGAYQVTHDMDDLTRARMKHSDEREIQKEVVFSFLLGIILGSLVTILFYEFLMIASVK